MYTCILVDDEPIATAILQTYVSRLDFLVVKDIFTSSVEAFAYLQANRVDLAFLDINMPGITGLQLLGSLSAPPKVILTTAYREYAAEGFELDVVDYLVKPFAYERFLKAVSKAFHKAAMPPDASVASPPPFVFVKQDKKFFKLMIDAIHYLASQRDFVEIYTKEGKYFTRETLSYFEDLLPGRYFLRVHRRYILALEAIHFLLEDEIYLTNGAVVPLGKTYRESVLRRLNLK